MPIELQGLGLLLKSLTSKESTHVRTLRGSSTTEAGLLRNDLRGSAFINAVEKHLSDYKSGNGQLSRDTGVILAERDRDTRSLINANSPKLAATYAGYASGLSYTRRARFIEGVSSAQQRVSEINSLKESTPTAKDIEELFKPKDAPLDVEA